MIFFLLAASSFAVAGEPVRLSPQSLAAPVQPTVQGAGEFLSAKKPPKIPPAQKKGIGIQFVDGCTDGNGRVLGQKDFGYDECLRGPRSPGPEPLKGMGQQPGLGVGSE